MYQFDSIQQALNYVFDSKKLSIINLPNNPYHWFFVDEIRTILEVKGDNYHFTQNLKFRDQVIAVLNLGDEPLVCYTMGNGVSNNLVGCGEIGDMPNGHASDFIANSHSEARRFMIISEPGLYELLIKSRMPKAIAFQEWLFFTVLPTLRANPQLVQEINRLSTELNDSRSLSMMQHDELVDLRKKYNRRIDDNRTVANIALNPYDGEPHNIMDLFNAFFAKKIEMCKIVDKNPRGINGLLDK